MTIRSLRLLRIISFLRLERSYSAMKNLRLIFARKKEEFLVVTYLTAVVVLTSSTFIYYLENAAQPEVFSSVGIGAWWAVETITSLGYGDFVPITNAGRFFGSILALWGIILFTIPGAVLGSAFIEVMLDKHREEEEEAYAIALRETMMHETGSFSSINSPLLYSQRISNFDEDILHIHEGHEDRLREEDEEEEEASPSPPVSSLRPPLSKQLSTQSFQRLTPRVATALRMDSLQQQMMELAATQVQTDQCLCGEGFDVLTRVLMQHKLQERLEQQQTQLQAITSLLQTLVSMSQGQNVSSM